MGMIAEYLMLDEETLRSLLKLDSEELSEELFNIEESEKFRSIDIEKMWDGLHYFLTGVSASEPIEGNKLSEAIVGVHNFSEDSEDDFIAYIRNKELPGIITALEQFDFKKQTKTFDFAGFRKNKIYPNIWIEDDREKLFEELETSFTMILEFYKESFSTKHHVMVSIL